MFSRNIGQSGLGALLANYNGSTASASGAGSAITVTLTFNTDGTVTTSRSLGSDTSSGIPCNWFLPTTAAIGNSYWVRATVTSGTLTSGTTGTWTQLSTNQSWTRNAGAPSVQTVVLTIEISDSAAGTNILYSGSVTITASGP